MKLTLAFTIFNKEQWLDSLLRSWLDTLSGNHEVEVIIVFDALRDSSAVIAKTTLVDYPHIPHQFLYAPDLYEIKCNNMALTAATGQVICFVQDDNWMYTRCWDDLLVQTWRTVNIGPDLGAVGAVGLLAGVRFNRDFSLNRIESDRPHKGENFAIHGIAPDAYPLAVYSVDVINRPFAVGVELLRMHGGLDEAYCPMDWDDADLSLQLLSEGFTNLYVPMDVVNLCAKKETLTENTIISNYQHGERIARERWAAFVAGRESSVRLLYPLMENADASLSL